MIQVRVILTFLTGKDLLPLPLRAGGACEERKMVGRGSGAAMLGVIWDGLGAEIGFLWEGLSTCTLAMVEQIDNTNYLISQCVARNAANMFLSLNDMNCARL